MIRSNIKSAIKVQLRLTKCYLLKADKSHRPILDAVLKQGALRLFQHGLIQFGTSLFR